MKNESSRFGDSTVFEGMTSIRAVISSMSDGTSDRKITKVLIDKSRFDKKHDDIEFLERIAADLKFEIEFCSSGYIDSLSIGSSHGGIVAVCTGRNLPALTPNEIVDNGFYVMIEGIEDPYNFGYAIRSIYASGADGIILSPRNWMSAAGVVCRSSAGTSELIKSYISTPSEAISTFKARNYKIAGAGIRDSVSAYDADLKRPLLLIVGGEKRGISNTLLSLCDMIVRLDYGREFRGSLSTASAASILSYEVLRQNRKESSD
ncbi:MAG: RNA methyltransferase [Clostridia bacterium]|nr:RNA methyltransferase [Clostridia bacterium]